jgi:hypothetical protein
VRALDLTDEPFGRLIARECVGSRNGRRLWRCDCKCGGSITIEAGFLRYGQTQSCGCLKRDTVIARNTTHGLTANNILPEVYSIWNNMRSRCYDPNDNSYHNYGGRGITISARWFYGEGNLSAYECFALDMGARPSLEHSIDRFPDMNGNYEASNCRWATTPQQARNRRQNVFITYRGVIMVLQDALIACGNNDSRYYRIKKRFDLSPQNAFDQMLSIPKRSHQKA